MTQLGQEQHAGDPWGRIEITVGDVNDVEAHVLARFFEEPAQRGPSPETVTLHGNVRGPYCESSRTLPADFQFRQISDSAAEAIITDPCQWSRELPHVYHVNVSARRGDQLVSETSVPIGLHRTTPRRTGIEFPG
jgi:hypothetical protein